MDSVFTSSASFSASKVCAALSGILGGLSVSFFWQPQRLHQHGKLAAGAIIGGISASAPLALGGIIARRFGFDFGEIDVALGIGYIVGAVSVGVIAWLANFFGRHENDDIVDVVRDMRRASSLQNRPASRPDTRKKLRITKPTRGKKPRKMAKLPPWNK